MKTSLFASAQRHNLSQYARLALQQTKKQITALRKIYAVEPAASIQRFKWRYLDHETLVLKKKKEI